MLDVLILNTAVADFRGHEFAFVSDLTGPGGVARCSLEDMPSYTQKQYRSWIDQGRANAGGSGNSAPLMAKAGIQTGVAANLGKGEYGGLDAQGRFFFDELAQRGIDMSPSRVHPSLPTGTAFIYEADQSERAGIAYFPNANDDFNFDDFRQTIVTQRPKVVYYMYSGLSRRGDANEGRDLAEFMGWCRRQGALTIVDSHTLAGDPRSLIDRGGTVEQYNLLRPVLAEADLFFTSYDEARLIHNTLARPRRWEESTVGENIGHFLEFVRDRFWQEAGRTRLFGVTVKDGAYHLEMGPDGSCRGPRKTESMFQGGRVVDLTGAGDSFRAGLISYTATYSDEFRKGTLPFDEAIQMGNLFAGLYVTAPLGDRYRHIVSFDRMLDIVRRGKEFGSFENLLQMLRE